MYELKTKETDISVIEFIENVENLKKREDAYKCKRKIVPTY
jgi:two-component SAPR family response regulator